MDKTLILSTGRGSIDLLNPTPEQVNIGDMLRNLSHIPRWCGVGTQTATASEPVPAPDWPRPATSTPVLHDGYTPPKIEDSEVPF